MNAKYIILQTSNTRYLVGKRGLASNKFNLIAECRTEISAEAVVSALNLTELDDAHRAHADRLKREEREKKLRAA